MGAELDEHRLIFNPRGITFGGGCSVPCVGHSEDDIVVAISKVS